MRSVLPPRYTESGDAILVAHPTAWGALRRNVIDESARRLAEDVQLVPRAAAIARSHLGTAAGRYAVVEVFDDRADVHTLRCHDGNWEVVNSLAGASDPSSVMSLIGTAVPDDIEAVLVDAADPEIVRTTVEIIERATVVGRVIPVDRWLLVRFGAARRPVTATPEVAASRADRRAARRIVPALVVAMVAAVLLVGVLAVADHRRNGETTRAGPGPSTAAVPTIETTVIGRVRIAIPAGWTQTREPRVSDNPAVWPRTTVADPAADRRISVMQFAIRAGATRQTVSSSLRARIQQRGSDDVQDFEEHHLIGARDVIAYRELSGSGRPVDWYVIAGDRIQVSVGCQAGSAVDIARECEQAVGSLVIDPA